MSDNVNKIHSSGVKYFYVSKFFNAIADALLLFAVPLFIYKETGSASMSGLVFFMEWLPRMLGFPISGLLCDRFNVKHLYMYSDFIRFILCIMCFYLVQKFPSYMLEVVIVVMAIGGALQSLSYVSAESSIARFFTKEQLPKQQSLLQGIELSTTIFSPALAALLLTQISLTVIFLIASVGYVLSFAIIQLCQINIFVNPKKEETNHWVEDIKFALRFIITHKYILNLVYLSFAINLILGFAISTAVIYTTGEYGKSNEYFGALQVLAGCCSVLILFSIPLLLKQMRIYILGFIAYISVLLGTVLVAIANSFEVYALAYILILLSGELFGIFIRSERVRYIPQEHLGKTIGVIVLLNIFSAPVAGLILALGGDLLGPTPIFIAISSCVFFLFIFLWPKLRTYQVSELAIEK